MGPWALPALTATRRRPALGPTQLATCGHAVRSCLCVHLARGAAAWPCRGAWAKGGASRTRHAAYDRSWYRSTAARGPTCPASPVGQPWQAGLAHVVSLVIVPNTKFKSRADRPRNNLEDFENHFRHSEISHLMNMEVSRCLGKSIQPLLCQRGSVQYFLAPWSALILSKNNSKHCI